MSLCLVLSGLRSDTSIVVETAQAFSTHHAAMLIGYGAHALCPYLAYETARQWRLSSRTQSLVKSGKVCGSAWVLSSCFLLRHGPLAQLQLHESAASLPWFRFAFVSCGGRSSPH